MNSSPKQHHSTPRIISASRRTDIPAYYADWFMRQVEAGYALYPNPITGKPVKISLHPDEVLFLVFWTRNPHPLEKHLDRLDTLFQRAYYFHFTINGLPKELETNNPPLEFAIHTFQRFASRYPGQVFWRYDPIVLSDLTPPEFHYERFEELATRLEGHTTRCYFSFVDWYQKVRRNFAKANLNHGVQFRDPESDERLVMTGQLVRLARKHGMSLYSCCEDGLCVVENVEKAHCVDVGTIGQIAPDRFRGLRQTPTRADCGCYESRDLGYYDSCPHGCIYCYANQNREKAKVFYTAYLGNRRLPLDEGGRT